MKFEEFEEGEKILFNDRKTPLTISDVSNERMLVEGPSGGEYEIYFDESTLLVCRKGGREYSSYCEGLRSVGEWVRSENVWRHSVSGAEIRVVEKDNGFWTIKSEKFDGELDNPLYGFTSFEGAVEEVEDFVGGYPEG